MPHRYSTALSHLVLAGAGAYCIYKCPQDYYYAKGSYILITVNSVLGVWRWGNPQYGDKVERVYEFTLRLEKVLAFPLIVTQIWLNYSYQVEYAYAHSLAGVLPIVLYLGNRAQDDLSNVIITINAVSLGVISYLHENFYGIAAAVSYLLNHFCIREDNLELEDSAIADIYNYGLCFFCYFALATMSRR